MGRFVNESEEFQVLPDLRLFSLHVRVSAFGQAVDPTKSELFAVLTRLE